MIKVLRAPRLHFKTLRTIHNWGYTISESAYGHDEFELGRLPRKRGEYVSVLDLLY